jgi:hypothetical protein
VKGIEGNRKEFEGFGESLGRLRELKGIGGNLIIN